MSSLLDHVNSVTPDQFGELQVDSAGGSFVDAAMTPVLSTPAIFVAVRAVLVSISQCFGHIPREPIP